jgi:pyrimidine-nucleoside phosphorylase
MKDPAEAEKLARSLVDTGAAMGLKVVALLTDMDEPLGNKVGNFLEVEESLDCLEGEGPEDLMEVILELAARMAVLGGKAEDSARGRELFLKNVQCQGGDPEKLLELRGKYRSKFEALIKAPRSGYISRIDAWKVGHAAVQLGVGRNRTTDKVSPTAGAAFHAKAGAKVAAGDPVMTVWAANQEGLEAALPSLAEAVEYSSQAPAPRKLILKEVN